MGDNSNSTQDQQALADQRRNALCQVVASLVRAQVFVQNTSAFWDLAVGSLLQDHGITMSATVAHKAYASHRTWAMANGGVDEREYITGLMRDREAERANAVYPPYMAIPVPSPPASKAAPATAPGQGYQANNTFQLPVRGSKAEKEGEEKKNGS